VPHCTQKTLGGWLAHRLFEGWKGSRAERSPEDFMSGGSPGLPLDFSDYRYFLWTWWWCFMGAGGADWHNGRKMQIDGLCIMAAEAEPVIPMNETAAIADAIIVAAIFRWVVIVDPRSY
jgi:hypothetical protein